MYYCASITINFHYLAAILSVFSLDDLSIDFQIINRAVVVINGLETITNFITYGFTQEKLRSLVADADNEVMIMRVQKDSDRYTVAEIMAYGKGGVDISRQEEILKKWLGLLS